MYRCHKNETQGGTGQLGFIYHAGAKEKEGGVVRYFKGQKRNSHGDAKANIW